MLHRLSIKPSTEKFFRNEQALSTYIENTIQSYGAIPLSTISNLVMGFPPFYRDQRSVDKTGPDPIGRPILKLLGYIKTLIKATIPLKYQIKGAV